MSSNSADAQVAVLRTTLQAAQFVIESQDREIAKLKGKLACLEKEVPAIRARLEQMQRGVDALRQPFPVAKVF